MFSTAYQLNLHLFRRYIAFALLGITLVTSAGRTLAAAQDQPPSQPPPNGQQKQEPPPAAGGPQSDTGPYAVPKKKEEPPLPPPEKPKKVEGMPDYSIKVDVPLVNVDVVWIRSLSDVMTGLVFFPSLEEYVTLSIKEHTRKLSKWVIPHPIFAITRLCCSQFVRRV